MLKKNAKETKGWKITGWLVKATGLFVVLLFFMLLFYVEDWSRDLTQNSAKMLFGEATTTATQVKITLRRFTQENRAWKLVSGPHKEPPSAPVQGPAWETRLPQNLREIIPENKLWFHLVRTTGQIGYQDDVVLWMGLVYSEKEFTENKVLRETFSLYGLSQSRLGRGDLGQNPRNLEELKRGLRPLLNKKTKE